MATNWFDWADAQQRAADDSLSELIEPAEAPEATEQADHAQPAAANPRRGLRLPHRVKKAADQPVAAAEPVEAAVVEESEPSAPRHSRKLTSVMGVTAALALAAMSGAAVMKMTEGDTSSKLLVASNIAVPSTTVPKAGPQPGVEAIDDDAKVAVAGSHCVPGAGETKVTETDTTLRGALAAFERAYFDRDADAVKAAFDVSTPLASRDWQQVLDKTVVDGTQWCLRMQPVDGDHVDASVTVTDPSGQASTYEQTVTASEIDGKYKLKDFS
ncbi:hypothetical protein M0E87_00140 [Corynebacterium sp. CCM 9185]|uniref:DUF8176 domain-containing protein n=1 Tax=Corynebacterium marambiense TaxID=2765364 RepID=A0ABS0VXX6_9CORY|nr:hypothetical protein [Corynebacterium marambiense]MBI9001613.1 hypothetical protein [Corynebacterium marambiense]MCK7662079.1 hypothetical protein [Corynebacterium marambiense]